jgi:hypothetical protein
MVFAKKIRAASAGWLLLVVLLAGCATAQVNWAERVGSYTCDQAVLELGPPDKSAKLQDGTQVMDWLTRRGVSQTYVSGGFWRGPWHGGGFSPAVTESYSPSYYLRLTFGPDSKLRAWKQFAR